MGPTFLEAPKSRGGIDTLCHQAYHPGSPVYFNEGTYLTIHDTWMPAML